MFNAGSGSLVTDLSGNLPGLDLVILDAASTTEWLPTGGLRILEPTALVPAGDPAALMGPCQAGNSMTIEAWFDSAQVNQNGTLIQYALDGEGQNYSLSQTQTVASARFRSTGTDDNANPAINSEPDSIGALHHVVAGWDPVGAEVWVDGELVAEEVIGGSFENWGTDFSLVIGNNVAENNPFLGDLHLMALYCSKLSESEVQQNFSAGY